MPQFILIQPFKSGDLHFHSQAKEMSSGKIKHILLGTQSLRERAGSEPRFILPQSQACLPVLALLETVVLQNPSSRSPGQTATCPREGFSMHSPQ